jgi:3-oxoadipate enol-lactonase
VGGAGELLVFLHGIGGNRRNWRPQLEFFAAHFRVAAWDARGYGDSEDYDGPLQFFEFARDLEHVLDHLGAPRAHLVGLSMGGRIARDYALARPERVASLVLANTSPGYHALSPEAIEAFLAPRRAPLLAGKQPADIAPGVVKSLLGASPAAGAHEAMIESISMLHKDSYLKTLEASVTQDRGAPIERITRPTLVITSDEDRLYPPELARAMAQRIPGAELVEIRGAGHISNLEQPEQFNQAVLHFLLRQT